MNRRQFLGGVAAGTTVLAGCNARGSDTDAAEYPWPAIEDAASEGWERVDKRQNSYDRSVLGVDAVTVRSERTSTTTANSGSR